MSRAVRLGIADDDVQQAEGLGELVRKLRPHWLGQGTAHNVSELKTMLQEVAPDVLLLDIHMPGVAEGAGVLDVVRNAEMPPIVVLVTGDPAYALQAFDSAAVDYVVKPVRPSRLAQALQRAEEMLVARTLAPAGAASAGVSTPTNATRWLAGSRGRDVVIVEPEQICFLQAERKYTRGILSAGEVLFRHGIGDLVSMLDTQQFVRIHRSTIINLRHVECLRRDEMGRLRVHMRGRMERLIVSRPFEHAFRDTAL